MTRRVVAVDQLRQFTAVELLSDPGHDPELKPIPQCMEVRFDYALPDGKVAHNVLHARYPTAYPGTIALANAFKTQWAALFTSSGLSTYLSTLLLLNSVSLRDLAVLNTLYIQSTSAATSVGADAGQALPLEVAAVLTQRTGISGPGGRGRIYMMGFTTLALAPSNVIFGACFTNLANFAAGIAAIFTGQGVTQCLALPSRIEYTGSTGRHHPARAATTADVIRTEIRDNHWDSQRRRGLK